jgi:WD40 repeat protein
MILWALETPQKTQYPITQQHHKNTKMTHRMQSFVGHGGPVWCLDFNGDTLVSGSYDKTIKVWSIKSSNYLATLRGHTSWVSCVSLKKDNTKLLSGGWDANVKVCFELCFRSFPRSHFSFLSSFCFLLFPVVDFEPRIP